MTKPLSDLAMHLFYCDFARLRQILAPMKWQIPNTHHNGVCRVNNLSTIKTHTIQLRSIVAMFFRYFNVHARPTEWRKTRGRAELFAGSVQAGLWNNRFLPESSPDLPSFTISNAPLRLCNSALNHVHHRSDEIARGALSLTSHLVRGSPDSSL